MITFLQRYFSFVLVLSLVAPLWLIGALSDSPSFQHRFRDALIWSGVLLALWMLIRLRRGYQVNGTWRKPEPFELKLYLRTLLGVLLIDFGSKAFFFRWDRPEQVELIKNFGLHSVFHETAFEPFHFFLLIYFLIRVFSRRIVLSLCQHAPRPDLDRVLYVRARRSDRAIRRARAIRRRAQLLLLRRTAHVDLPAVRVAEFLELRLDAGRSVRTRRFHADRHFADVVSRSDTTCQGQGQPVRCITRLQSRAP